MKHTDPVRVPKAVWHGIEAVRISGKTNMLDFLMVQCLAFDMEYFETVIWMEDNPDLYTRGIFAGFEVEGGDN
ncbi:MAG: DUF5049 domain-containing protein [Armatimonadetes bacterium]|jgi:hypothetical protein|nr:DUF5049 domain-containing protein [Armatimonadota bacterium]